MEVSASIYFVFSTTVDKGMSGTENSPPPNGLALKPSLQNPSASPVLEVAPLFPIGNFPMQSFPIIGKFLMLQSNFRSGATSPYREFPYAKLPHRGIPYASPVLEVAPLSPIGNFPM